MKKSLIAILMTTVILLSLMAPLLSIPIVQAADPSSWYKTVNGVLATDYYSLYPYETNPSLKIGFSKFGELINSDDNVGLEYGAVDPFAYPVGAGISSTVPKRMWVQGWLINITYTHRTQGARNVWACALHSDSVEYGNDWIRVEFADGWSDTYGYEDPRDPGYLIYGTGTYGATLVNGGRKTNGTAVTDSIEVLYDGPREFIAVCRTTIYDHLTSIVSNSTVSDVALAQIAITIRFDKVKKNVVLLKDVKSLLVEKEGLHMKVQFSNRGEVDLGTAAVGVSSYAHFYTEGTAPNDTSAEGLPTVYDSSWQIIQTEDPEDTDYENYSVAGPYPQDEDATYDLAQAINTGAGYVWSAAFWPSLSDWTIDGWDNWWHSLMAYDPHYIDAAVEEPLIPFYIGEWDFVLYHTLDNSGRTQFRGVTQYSVTDWHDGDDVAHGGANVIDSEVMYYCDETFNPYDLENAVHKEASRWVAFIDGPLVEDDIIDLEPNPIQTVWDEYCSFAERIILLPDGDLWVRDEDYTLDADNITLISEVDDDQTLKILWSALGTYVTAEDNANDTGTFGSPDDDLGVYLYSNSTAAPIEFYIVTPEVNPDMDATLKLGVYDVDRFSQVDAVYLNGSLLGILSGATGTDTIAEFYIPNALLEGGTMHFVQVFIDVNPATVIPQTIDPFNATTWPTMLTAWAVEVDWAMLEFMPRYEWVTVGRDAATVDSVGASLVSAAFKNKQVEIGIAGSDMWTTVVANQMPSVMSKFGAGTAWADYQDASGRAALKDDWCTYWPVASSNMIGVGGPIANKLAYYGNDFTDAFYGLTQYAGTAYSGKITGIPCWNRGWDGTWNVYASDSSTGYAVISTYKDINGTVLFLVWGHWGRDTYYASQWLHGDEARGILPGIVQLQSAPGGLTSIILEIDYTDSLHPTFSVVECLGTISETEWTHGSEVKGGIHDP